MCFVFMMGGLGNPFLRVTIGDKRMKYSILEKQDRVTGQWNSLVVSEGGKENVTPGAHPNVNKLPEVVDDSGGGR